MVTTQARQKASRRKKLTSTTYCVNRGTSTPGSGTNELSCITSRIPCNEKAPGVYPWDSGVENAGAAGAYGSVSTVVLILCRSALIFQLPEFDWSRSGLGCQLCSFNLIG